MSRIYYPNLNGLRFFAALSVMIYHFYGTKTLNGHFGVTLFFVLSGFLITSLLLEEKQQTETISIPKFYIRRFLRIAPLYFFIIILSSISFFYAESANTSIYKEALPYYLFFLPNLALVLKISLPYAGVL